MSLCHSLCESSKPQRTPSPPSHQPNHPPPWDAPRTPETEEEEASFEEQTTRKELETRITKMMDEKCLLLHVELAKEKKLSFSS